MSYTEIKNLEDIRNKKVLFLDIETTNIVKTPFGLPPENEYPDYKSKQYDNVRILSIGWLYMEEFDYDYDITLEHINERFIKPKNFNIPADSIKIHGITEEFVNKKGKSIEKVFKIIENTINECEYIIGYNVFFDVNILLSELYRIKINNIIEKILYLKENKKILCAGILASKHAKPDNWKQYNNYQIPKQIEVYKKCFNKYPEKAHNAKSDILAMINIIFWIWNNNDDLFMARYEFDWEHRTDSEIEKEMNDILHPVDYDSEGFEVGENECEFNRKAVQYKTLKILSYNLFYGEDEEQIKYINDNGYDILFLQEVSQKANNNLNKYFGDIVESHCEYTYLGLNKKLNFKIINTIKYKGIIINHLIINNIELVLGSLHLYPSKNNYDKREEQMQNIQKMLTDNKLIHLPIILGGDTNMKDDENFNFFDDIYLKNNNNKNYYTTYPNRNFTDNRVQFTPRNNFRYDRFLIKNCKSIPDSFETVSNLNSDHLAIKTIIILSF